MSERKSVQQLVVLGAVAAAVALGACSGSDDGDNTTTTAPTALTQPPPATTTPTTVAPTTTMAPTTTAAPTTTSTTVPPTTTVEDLKARITADYLAADGRIRDYLADPTAERLESVLVTVAAPDSDYGTGLRSAWNDLVAVGDAIVLNDPPVYEVTVEQVEIDGAGPAAGALLTVCRVTNSKRVQLPKHSPNGEEFYVSGGDLRALRTREHVVPTASGWLRDTLVVGDPVQYKEALACPAA